MKKPMLFVIGVLLAFNLAAAENHGAFTEAQLCLAGIRTINASYEKGAVTLLGHADGISTVKFAHNNGKDFTYLCKVEGGEIFFRELDKDWNIGIKLFYTVLDGNNLDVTLSIFGSTAVRPFTLDDL